MTAVSMEFNQSGDSRLLVKCMVKLAERRWEAVDDDWCMVRVAGMKAAHGRIQPAHAKDSAKQSHCLTLAQTWDQ